MKELIVTADDFGYDSAVNEAVVAAYRDGVLRYASLMVDRPAAGEAVSPRPIRAWAWAFTWSSAPTIRLIGA